MYEKELYDLLLKQYINLKMKLFHGLPLTDNFSINYSCVWICSRNIMLLLILSTLQGLLEVTISCLNVFCDFFSLMFEPKDRPWGHIDNGSFDLSILFKFVVDYQDDFNLIN